MTFVAALRPSWGLSIFACSSFKVLSLFILLPSASRLAPALLRGGKNLGPQDGGDSGVGGFAVC